MPLVTSKKMLEDAYKGNYAIGAFNINNMEILQGVVQAAKAEKAPLYFKSALEREDMQAPYI